MGNHLVSLAPSQIVPVEQYVAEWGKLNFKTSLGSTRFLKVALCSLPQSPSSFSSDPWALIVVKVFALPDDSLSLAEVRKHRDRLIEIKRSLDGCLNCLPFQWIELTERAGFLAREYVKQSLYDRMTTRPYLSVTEKRWIAFQLLLAIKQAHTHKVCHGDIKSENVMVTSWNWVFLTDFASFKPTNLPEDNPADFSFFFDTSRKRNCYIAPERFKSSAAYHVSGTKTDSSSQEDIIQTELLEAGSLVPTMDIFSAGCVIAELFTEAPLFSFSNLLAYKVGEFEPTTSLEKIQCPHIRGLVEHMIDRDPNARKSASDYLFDQRGKAFPGFFYSFLQLYMQMYSSDWSVSPDQKVLRVQDELTSIIDMVGKEPGFDSSGLSLIVSLLTANIRGLKFSNAKMAVLNSLSNASFHLTDDTILERIVPFITSFLKDPSAMVKVNAISSLVCCLKNVKQVPQSDVNIFPEFILPFVLPLCNDVNETVRVAMAKHVAEIGEEAVRYLDLATQEPLGSISTTNGNRQPSDFIVPNYEAELRVLHDLISQWVSVLLADTSNAVKQALMLHSLTSLAVLFGKQKANDVLLSHMITFLNDKDDPHLRSSFYEHIVGLAAYVGQHSTHILIPLFQQTPLRPFTALSIFTQKGLCDTEEFVITQCIATMSQLAKLGLLQKVALCDLVKETGPYLLHPNLWIRQASAGFIASAASTMDKVDVLVKLGSRLRPFMRQPVVQLEQPYLILANCEAALPRLVYDNILRQSLSTVFEIMNTLEERQAMREKSQSTYHSDASYIPNSQLTQSMQSLLRRLVSDGLSVKVEDKLLYFKDNIIKMVRQRCAMKKVYDDRNENGNTDSSAAIDLGVMVNNNEIEVSRVSLGIDETTLLRAIEETDPPRSASANEMLQNDEWQHMLGSESEIDLLKHKNYSHPRLEHEHDHLLLPFDVGRRKTLQRVQKQPSAVAACQAGLDQLIENRRNQFLLNTKKQDMIQGTTFAAIDQKTMNPNWRPRGVLVAHLHEHQGAISKLVRVPERPLFASASTDGLIKLWDCSKIEGSSAVNKSIKQLRHHEGSSVISSSVCSSKNDYLASSAENGAVAVTSLETGAVLHRRVLSSDTSGPAVSLTFQETGFSSPLLIFATSLGLVVGWDLRSNTEAFRLENELRLGLQTALAMSEEQTWAVSGTSSGALVCWDLRFQLPVVTCSHPAENRVRDIVVQPGSQCNVIVAMQNNNEVGFWNLEGQGRQRVLWASSAPLLSKTNPSTHCVTSLQPLRTSTSSALLTAGSDMRIRFWDLNNYADSFIMARAGSESLSPSSSSQSIEYSRKVVENIEVYHELVHPGYLAQQNSPNRNQRQQSNDSGLVETVASKPGFEPPPVGHHDCISSLAICQARNCFVVSGDRQGVIKVWA